MKISSVSKKVLASALSAAMVVAFAPTVAMGKIAYGTTVNVKYDLNGGTLKDTAITSVPSGTATANPDGTVLTIIGDGIGYTADSDVITNAGAKFNGWFYDADDDGAYDDTKGDVMAAKTGATAGTLDVTNIGQTDEITLKASYKFASTMYIDGVVDTTNNATRLWANVDEDYSDATYTWQMTCPDGHVVTVDNAADGGIGSYAYFDLDDHPASGKYTFAVKNAAKETLAQVTYELVKVTLNPGNYGTFSAAKEFYVTKGTAYGTIEDRINTNIPAAAGDYTFAGYYTDAQGNAVAGALNKDTTLYAAYSYPRVESGTFTNGNTLTFGARTMNAFNGNAAVKDFTATVTGPNGFSKSWNISTDKLAAGAGTEYVIDGITVTFGQEFEGVTAEGGKAYKTTAEAEAGDYTLSLSANKVAGDQYANTKLPSVASKTVSVAGVTVDLDGGTWKEDITVAGTAKNAYDAVVKLYQADVQGIKAAMGDPETDGSAIETLLNYVKTPEGKVIDYKNTTFNGVKYADLKNTAKIPASGMVVKVAYKDGLAAPELASITAEGVKYKMAFTAAEGKLYYSYDGAAWSQLPDDGTITVDPSAHANFYVKAKASGSESDALLYTSYAASVATFDVFAIAALNVKASNSTDKAPVVYSSKLTTVKADGEAALKAIGYAEAAEWRAAVIEQEKAVVEAIAAYEVAQLDAKKPLTASKDGKTYTYLTEAMYNDAVAGIQEVVAAFDLNNDADYTNNVKVNNLTNPTAAAYATAICKASSSAATVTVEAADAEAAIAVTEALKAATTGEAAEKALADYAALTDAQKELVEGAAIASAQEIKAAADKAAAEEEAKKAAEEAAAALAAQQDQAAVNYVNSTKSKTVKLGKAAKTKKAQTITWKSKVSASGNVVTYAKKSGSAKIKVAANGTATLKKGVKAGKYTAKVTVTCGSATRTVNVKFVVK